jgi:cell division protein FtsW (lipid II flippase)
MNEWMNKKNCASNMLKNKGLDWTTSVVLCFISKLFLVLDKQGDKGRNKNWNSYPHWTTGQLFVLCTSCLKYQSNILTTKHRITQNLFNILNVCYVLYCLVMFCLILTFCKLNGCTTWIPLGQCKSNELNPHLQI